MFRIPFYLGALFVFCGATPNTIEVRVGVIGLGIFLVIASRIWQAEAQFKQLKEFLTEARGNQAQSLVDAFAEVQRQKKS